MSIRLQWNQRLAVTRRLPQHIGYASSWERSDLTQEAQQSPQISARFAVPIPPLHDDLDMSVRSMLAALLGSITDTRRAGAFALLWLLVLTVLNVQTAGSFRPTILFAIPVVVVSWSSWRLGFLFAALSVIAAKFGGAMPEPGSTSPLWLDGMLAFIKLSIDALVANAWGRRRRRLADNRAEDLPGRGQK